MTVLNGVDVEDLNATLDAVKANPELARVSFRVESQWAGGFRGASQTGAFTQAGEEVGDRRASFRFESDEPSALLGSDTAASPAEYALEALAACYAVTFSAIAASRGIQMDALRLELEGRFDLHSFLGLDESARPGMQELKVTAYVTSPDATRDELIDLLHAVERRSPIRDTFASPVPVTTELGEDEL